MMGLFFAWSVGEGIIVWRWFKAKAPPTPGALLLPTALYLSLAILAEYQPARAVATTFAWAVDLAILMQVVGKTPAQATGWPPPALADTVIWPGGAGSSAATSTGTSAKPSAASTAESAASRSSQIIKDITELPGFGGIT
jgi:hypothetical protein